MDILLVESHTLHHLHSKTTQLKYDKHVCKAVKFHRQRGQPIDWFSLLEWLGGFWASIHCCHAERLVGQELKRLGWTEADLGARCKTNWCINYCEPGPPQTQHIPIPNHERTNLWVDPFIATNRVFTSGVATNAAGER